ncbi:polysaccharide deacetylase family protein [Skermania piniformis]|uniref:polysaccharide deacetylase family protein n=1 Tax=Skermania pinensis TaxID=39122 RepID=UPI001FE76AFC|nr:polysaccharide deacetylase family protein [Skermania piniformis]
MHRRQLLGLLAAGTVTAITGCTREPDPHPAAAPDPGAPTTTSAPLLPPPPPRDRRAPAPDGVLTKLPTPGPLLALTVDDGADPDVVGAYIRFAEDTGARFTFFVTARYPGWIRHRDRLRPLVDSGQIQLGNHTWSHPDLTSLSQHAIADELRRTHDFLHNTYGVDATPYYRPPFGYHNPTVDAVAADLGYTHPTLWYGSLSDSGLITEDYLLQCAHRYFTAQAIVIGHANFPPVTRVYPQLVEIIRERGLSMVTLDDAIRPDPGTASSGVTSGTGIRAR